MGDRTTGNGTPPTTEGERSDGEGTIEERGGRFRARMPRHLDPQRRSHTFDTQEEAESFLRGASVLLSREAPDGVETLRTWAPRWLEAREREGVRGVAQERSVWRCHLEGDALATLPLAGIARRDVREWLERVAARRVRLRTWDRDAPARHGRKLVSKQTLKHCLRVLRGALAAARTEGLVREGAADPTADVAVPRRPQDQQEAAEDPVVFLTLDELAQVLACEQVPQGFKLMLRFCVRQGLRPGELWALRWRDVQLEGARPQLTVRFSHDGPTKSARVRTIPLLPDAAEALRLWKPECPKSKRGLVFPSARGGQRGLSNDAQWGDRVREKGTVRPGWRTVAGLTRRVTFYQAVRHTCASHLVMGSWGEPWSLQEVAALLGHTDVEVTQRYAHLHPDHLHRKAAKTGRGGGSGTTNLVPNVLAPLSLGEGNPLARNTGFEPVTFGSGGSLAALGTTGESGRLGPAWDQERATALARALLTAVAAHGEAPLELIEQLAHAVLAHPWVQLARGAMAPGSFQMARALELAASVVAAAPRPATQVDGSGRR